MAGGVGARALRPSPAPGRCAAALLGVARVPRWSSSAPGALRRARPPPLLRVPLQRPPHAASRPPLQRRGRSLLRALLRGRAALCAARFDKTPGRRGGEGRGCRQTPLPEMKARRWCTSPKGSEE